MASPMPRRCSTISSRRCLAASAPLRRAPGSRLLRMVNQAGRPCCESGSVPDSHSTAEDQEIPPGRGIAPRPGGPGQHSDAVPLRPSPPPAARGNPPPCHTYLRVTEVVHPGPGLRVVPLPARRTPNPWPVTFAQHLRVSLSTQPTVRRSLSGGYPGTKRQRPLTDGVNERGRVNPSDGAAFDRSESQHAPEGQSQRARARQWKDPPRSSNGVR